MSESKGGIRLRSCPLRDLSFFVVYVAGLAGTFGCFSEVVAALHFIGNASNGTS